MGKTTKVTWRGFEFELYPDRALTWPARQALILADPHFGKADHFRAAGVPVPWGPTQKDLARLSRLLDETGTSRLIILGDFFHAADSQSDDVTQALARFRDRHAGLEMVLVRGNHDRHAGLPPQDLDILDAGDRYDEAGLVMLHEPTAVPDATVLAGHVHPAVRLLDTRARQSMRLACFHFAESVATLPAFGSFTGTYVIKPVAGDRVYAVTPEPATVVPVTPDA